eukprot:CAMPEP_0170550346 /NCGR_PEP_ID=MMETSP0211-20121228/8402_1 /TAXON_ID=311385 /ORGANISM="Pseudokeronopsis sp., Strain OXSARD2" /LENGTH=44 /DNA_ID= /DNA_START= /DNA_END= /DNA_ORIENTATION=
MKVEKTSGKKKLDNEYEFFFEKYLDQEDKSIQEEAENLVKHQEY